MWFLLFEAAISCFEKSGCEAQWAPGGSITLSAVRPEERGFFTACGGTSDTFLEERCDLKRFFFSKQKK